MRRTRRCSQPRASVRVGVGVWCVHSVSVFGAGRLTSAFSVIGFHRSPASTILCRLHTPTSLHSLSRADTLHVGILSSCHTLTLNQPLETNHALPLGLRGRLRVVPRCEVPLVFWVLVAWSLNFLVRALGFGQCEPFGCVARCRLAALHRVSLAVFGRRDAEHPRPFTAALVAGRYIVHVIPQRVFFVEFADCRCPFTATAPAGFAHHGRAAPSALAVPVPPVHWMIWSDDRVHISRGFASLRRACPIG